MQVLSKLVCITTVDLKTNSCVIQVNTTETNQHHVLNTLVRAHTCMHRCPCRQTHTHKHITCTHARTQMHTHTHTHAHSHKHTHTHICAHTYACMHTCTHTHTKSVHSPALVCSRRASFSLRSMSASCSVKSSSSSFLWSSNAKMTNVNMGCVLDFYFKLHALLQDLETFF